MPSGTTTTNHDEIRKRSENGGGTPTMAEGIAGQDGEGILREPDGKLRSIG